MAYLNNWNQLQSRKQKMLATSRCVNSLMIKVTACVTRAHVEGTFIGFIQSTFIYLKIHAKHQKS